MRYDPPADPSMLNDVPGNDADRYSTLRRRLAIAIEALRDIESGPFLAPGNRARHALNQMGVPVDPGQNPDPEATP